MPFGGLVRNLHYWSAQLLLLVMGVHLARVVFTGAYAPPRRFNHLLGLALLVVAILLDFTGYVLRWDQGIQWALVVGTNLISTIPVVGPTLHVVVAGGAELGSGDAALVRFYAWHIFGLALLFVSLERMAPIPPAPGWRHRSSPTVAARWITNVSRATNSCVAKSSP